MAKKDEHNNKYNGKAPPLPLQRLDKASNSQKKFVLQFSFYLSNLFFFHTPYHIFQQANQRAIGAGFSSHMWNRS